MKWHKCPWPKLLLHYLISILLYLLSHEDFPKASWLQKRKLEPGFQVVLCSMQVPHESGQLLHCRPFLRYLGGTMMKGNPPGGRTSNSAAMCPYCLGEEKARSVRLSWLLRSGKCLDWMVCNLERNFQIISDKEIRGRCILVLRPLWMGSKHEDVCVPYECLPKAALSRGRF